MSSVPSEWDNSKAIDGKISEYIIMARNKGANWYLSGLNNETVRSGEVKLDFLGEGNYTATIFADGINANKIGTDYAIKKIAVNNMTLLPYEMANGGGFAVAIIKD
ncbi:MAG: glycoside hydrolase family 97 C-terminal domain-containing protein [Panacibacter sp.]